MHALRNCGSSVNALISDGSSFHQVGAKVKKALFLVEIKQMSWLLGISSRFASDERSVLHGVYGKRQLKKKDLEAKEGVNLDMEEALVYIYS